MSERLPLLRLSVTLLTLAVAAVAGWFLWRTYEDSPWTRDARVRANVVQVTPDVSGVVIDVRVRDNQNVKVGDVLFVIDQARFQLALLNAEAAVVGASDDQTGQAICAFVILKSSAHGGAENMVEELRAEVSKEISPIARPREIHVVPELPKTRSGKIMRRLLRDVAEGRELGDTSTLVDPSVFEAIRASK